MHDITWHHLTDREEEELHGDHGVVGRSELLPSLITHHSSLITQEISHRDHRAHRVRQRSKIRISTGSTGSTGLRRQGGPSSEAFTAITDITAPLITHHSSLITPEISHREHRAHRVRQRSKIRISTGHTGSTGLRRQGGPSSEAFTAIADITASLSSLARVHTEITEDTESGKAARSGSPRGARGPRGCADREALRAKRSPPSLTSPHHSSLITHHSSLQRFHTESTELRKDPTGSTGLEIAETKHPMFFPASSPAAQLASSLYGSPLLQHVEPALL